MNEKTDHLEQLLSRLPDGDLTPAEHATVRRALADDPGLAAVAKQYERLHLRLRAYRPLPGDVDWRAFSTRVADGVEDEWAEQASSDLDRAIDPAVAGATAPVASGPRLNPVAESYRGVEDALQDWARPLPQVDWAAFHARVSDAVRAEAASARAGQPVRGLRRWVTPVAAAAAVALVVWGLRLARPPTAGPGGSTETVILVALDLPTSGGQITFSFDETPAAGARAVEPPAGGAGIAVGPRHDELEDIDDAAYFY
ncbi:MAG: hypothetical protein ACE5E1_04050 [Phycisphaerae bacterium]